MSRFLVPVLSFALGIGAAGALSIHVAQAESAMRMPAGTNPGDAAMRAAMDTMQSRMGSMKMTGDQDRDFMLEMIPHHQSAVDMAKAELKYGKRPEVKALARSIITSQEKEIRDMRRWLRIWYKTS